MTQARATIFVSPSSQKAAGQHAGKLYFNSTVSDFDPKELSEELCHGGFRKVHSIGSRSCTFVEHPGAKIPLLNRSSQKHRRDYQERGNLDHEANREVLDRQRTVQPIKVPALNHDGTSYGDAHVPMEPTRRRQAKRDIMKPICDGGITGGDGPLINKSFSHDMHADPTGRLSRPKGEAWPPVHALSTGSRKLDFWVSTSEREYRPVMASKHCSRTERAHEIDELLIGLRRASLARCSSTPSMRSTAGDSEL
eukprot:TRINITY_DN9507_c0_g4_i1.p1 TRINITY_DN9507_c0_g4~~TRINITY_DN9507_c0_g4_i1.p1  ORF type:complete len:252 (+),score=34.27 TRINITY_DN9507_c0_g4_i1:160-915(+)